MSSSATQLVWFVTGASSGLGFDLVREALARHDLVFATSRSPHASSSLQALKAQFPDTLHLVQLDITASMAVIKQCIDAALGIWGRIDLVVNNAGYSLVGLAEEAGAASFERMFQTNLYGPINITNAILPHMRERKSGTIVFVGSRSAWRPALPGLAMYGGSKAALQAYGDALAVEVSSFSIRILNAIPGGMRTRNINNVILTRGPSPEYTWTIGSESPITSEMLNDDNTRQAPYKAYDPMFSLIDKGVRALDGSQTGDSSKAARTIVDVVRGEGVALGENGSKKPWPGTLFLGSDCLRDVRHRCSDVLAKIEDWEDVGKGIDVDCII